jgi:hypothetical protein
MTKNEISETLKSLVPLTPHQIAEMRGWLGGQYAYLNDQLVEVLTKKSEEWTNIRYSEGVKSDTAAERIWQRSPDGQRETFLRMELKSIEKLMQGLKARSEVMMGEAKNQY